MLNFSKNALKIFMLFVLLTALVLANAKNESQKFSAVWAWEIASDKRKIYLLGELHSFQDLKNKTVDYQLGHDIYQSTSEIVTEFDGWAKEKNPSTSLSLLLGLKTWNRLKTAVADTFNDLGVKNIDKKFFFQEFDQSSAYSAYHNLVRIAGLRNLIDSQDFLSGADGLGGHLKKTKKISFEYKRTYIEHNTTSFEAWAKHCGDSDKAITLVNVVLDRLEKIKTIGANSILNVQDVFIKSDSSLDELMDAIVESKEGDILRECIITPRNYLWLPKLKQTLETDGPPVTFLVGIGHVGGSEGLIALLQKEGYTNIQRIYAVK